MIIRDERGNATLLVLIALLIVMFTAALIPIEGLRTLHASEMVLKESVAESVKSASMCVNTRAKEEKKYIIEPNRAHRKFKSLLASNMSVSNTLDVGTGTGFTGNIDYVFVVINPPNEYSPSMMFTKDNPSGTNISSPSLPFTFTVGEDGYNKGGKTVTFTKSGCTAIVFAEARPVTGKEPTKIFKWAAAELVEDVIAEEPEDGEDG